LPEVGRSLGRGIVEFKKGLRDTGDEIKASLPKDSDIGGGDLADTREAKRPEESKRNDGFNTP
jgi:Sec-independent protein translocase protein TatA